MFCPECWHRELGQAGSAGDADPVRVEDRPRPGTATARRGRAVEGDLSERDKETRRSGIGYIIVPDLTTRKSVANIGIVIDTSMTRKRLVWALSG